jgi:hypothetical protein
MSGNIGETGPKLTTMLCNVSSDVFEKKERSYSLNGPSVTQPPPPADGIISYGGVKAP